jgi:hypothetical protein
LGDDGNETATSEKEKSRRVQIRRSEAETIEIL